MMVPVVEHERTDDSNSWDSHQFAPTCHRKEYIQWITGAKTEATHMNCLKAAIEWMEAGKSRHWKYANC